MTDAELDVLMQKVLLDAIALDEENYRERISFEPSRKYQNSVFSMLEDPLRWAKRISQPVWKRIGQRVAALLLISATIFGSIMLSSPTARAVVRQWIATLYETYISYQYTQTPIAPGKMPEYVITALPEGYEENTNERVEWPNYVQRRYQNVDGDMIFFDYVYMSDGSEANIETENVKVHTVMVNGHQGVLYEPQSSEASDCTLSWFDTDQNLHFTIDAAADRDEIIHMAESVKLFESTK